MKIAVLGWGSLIWCPGCLRIKTRWRKDGPKLPIEFARISKGDRLTLVIHPGAELQQTFWAVNQHEDLEKARKNLMDREGCLSLNPIHALERRGNSHGAIDHCVKTVVKAWLDAHDELDVAIWTGLGSNWEDKRSCAFCLDDAVQYLRCLETDDWAAAAEEYIRNAPKEIMTDLRRRIESELGWTAVDLAEILFEEDA